jgi:hypothetical protein
MKRRLFQIFTILSVLMCVISAILWIASQGRLVAAMREHATAKSNEYIFNELAALNGRIALYQIRDGNGVWDGNSPQWTFTASEVNAANWSYELHFEKSDEKINLSMLGISYCTHREPGSVEHQLSIPCSFLVASSAVLPLIALRRRLKKRQMIKRQRAGLCVHCGYNLRDSLQRCPECGSLASEA